MTSDTFVHTSAGRNQLRDCPVCHAEDSVIVPDLGPGSPAVALEPYASRRSQHVLCRHCRSAFGIVRA